VHLQVGNKRYHFIANITIEEDFCMHLSPLWCF